MLGKPFAGWSHIEVNGNYIGTASYLDWIPGLVIEKCIEYLKDRPEDYEIGGGGFNLEFDAEGWSFGIVEIGTEFFTYHTKTNAKPYVVITDMVSTRTIYGSKFIRKLMAEAVSDIEENFEEWVQWDAFDKDDERRNRKELRSLIRKAKKYIA